MKTEAFLDRFWSQDRRCSPGPTFPGLFCSLLCGWWRGEWAKEEAVGQMRRCSWPGCCKAAVAQDRSRTSSGTGGPRGSAFGCNRALVVITRADPLHSHLQGRAQGLQAGSESSSSRHCYLPPTASSECVPQMNRQTDDKHCSEPR